MPLRVTERSKRFTAGLSIALIALIGGYLLKDRFSHMPELYSLSVVGLLLASGGLLAESLGITPAVIELILGVMAGVIGLPRAESVELLGLIGSVFIMYIAGLEIDPGLLRRMISSSIISGIISFLAPVAVAFLGLRIMGYDPLESWLASIGTATTSVAVVYAIIRRRALIRRSLGQLILATAMIADVTSIIAFILVEAGISLPMIIYFTGIIIVVLILSKFLDWVSGGEHEIELRLILSFLIAAALISEYVGVHAILFAFLLGVSNRKTIIKSRILEEKIAALTFGLLAPIFFINAGLHATPENPLLYIKLAGLLLLLTFPVKVLATHLTLKSLAKRRVKLRVSSVFGARLTVSTVIAYTGEATGKLSRDLAGAIIMSALIATIIAAIIARTPIPEEA